MSKYQVIGNIKRDGKLLARNKPAEFDDAEAARLVRDGYLQPIAAAKNSEGEQAGDGHQEQAPGLESQAGVSPAGAVPTETVPATTPARAAKKASKKVAKKTAKAKAE